VSSSRPETLKHIQQVGVFLKKVEQDLASRRIYHDESKLESPEVEVFDEFTPKLAASTYGSDEYKSYLAAMKPALDHHYAANDHHPEHFCWYCPVCNLWLNKDQHETAPEGPNDTGTKYCPRCCKNGMLYESQLVAEPRGSIEGMGLHQLIEMLCDWKAATLRHNDGCIRRSIEHNQGRFGYSDELKQILLNTLPLLETDQ
jgi:hypothetical protein